MWWGSAIVGVISWICWSAPDDGYHLAVLEEPAPLDRVRWHIPHEVGIVATSRVSPQRLDRGWPGCARGVPQLTATHRG
jgi:hypothetical protein